MKEGETNEHTIYTHTQNKQIRQKYKYKRGRGYKLT